MATYEAVKYSFVGSAITAIQSPNIADGSVTNTEFQHLDGTTSDIQTQLDAKFGSSGGTFTGNVSLNDNVHLYVGSGGATDLDIYHDSSNSYIKNSTGNLNLNSDSIVARDDGNTLNMFNASSTGAFNAYYADTLRFSTTNSGSQVTGELVVTGNMTSQANVNGNGQNLTNLNASNVASGTLPMARLSGTLPALNGSALTNLNGSNISSGTVADARISTLTSSKLTGALPALDGSALTSLNASNLASGTVPDARLPASALTSDWVKISTSESGSNVANLQFLGTYSDYRHLKVMLHGKWQNMDNAQRYLSFRVSLNASNFSSSSIYHFTHLFMSTNASNFSYFGSGATQVYFSRWNPYGNQGDKTMSSEITLFGINETNAHKAFIANGGSWDRSQTGDVHYNLAGGTINSTSAIRGIQLFHADGANISAGCGATLYGIK